MEFKNALSILFSNVGYVFKILLYFIVVLVITLGVGAAIIYPIWNSLVDTTDIMVHVDAIRDSLRLVWDGSHNLRYAAGTFMPEIVLSMKSAAHNTGALVGLVFAVLFVYCLYTFLMGICSYTVADIVNKLMASNLRFGFASDLVLNLKKSAKFSIARLSVALPVDIVAIILFVGIGMGLYSLIGVITMPFIFVLAVVICTLRSLLFAGWLPRYLYHENERPYACLSRSFPSVRANIWGLIKSYVVMYILLYLLSTAFFMPTGGVIALLLPPISYFVLRAVELVGYYKTKHFNFYVDGTTVVKTVEYGFRSDNQFERGGEYGEFTENTYGKEGEYGAYSDSYNSSKGDSRHE